MLTSAGIALDYMTEAGPYTVKFNSSQDLTILPPIPHEETGSHASGWDITVQDNQSHQVALMGIIEEESIVPVSNALMDMLLDNNLETQTTKPSKKNIKLNGIDGRMVEEYSPIWGLNFKIAIAPFGQSYDPFYNRTTTKSFILLKYVNLRAYDEIADSLNITKNKNANLH